MNSSVVTISANTCVHARRDQTGCASITLQGMTFRLAADLTIVADGVTSTNGLKVISTDGQPHTLRLLMPGTAQTCASGRDITLLGGTTVDAAIAVQLFTPGKIVTNGPKNLTGKVTARCLAATGQVHVTQAVVPTPGA